MKMCPGIVLEACAYPFSMSDSSTVKTAGAECVNFVFKTVYRFSKFRTHVGSDGRYHQPLSFSSHLLKSLCYPMDFANGVAANLTGDDPDTEEILEGFPDIFTTTIDKGYSGNATPRGGYVLYNHAKILTDNTTRFETVSYITVLTTKYYYTCEADGTVRQFDGADADTATEYLGSEEFKIEVVVTVDVDIYTKPEG